MENVFMKYQAFFYKLQCEAEDSDLLLLVETFNFNIYFKLQPHFILYKRYNSDMVQMHFFPATLALSC